MLKATAIHDVISRNITLLPGPVKDQYFYFYMGIDVWSRRILGVEVHERESSELAEHFFDRICRYEGISPVQPLFCTRRMDPQYAPPRWPRCWRNWGLRNHSRCHASATRMSMTSHDSAR
jgi:hypothetical protein